MNQNELYHHGVLGQKWGVRRYQNEDGSLTSKGYLHYSKVNSRKADKVIKVVGAESNTGKEIRKAQMESNYKKNWWKTYNKATARMNIKIEDINAKYKGKNLGFDQRSGKYLTDAGKKYTKEISDSWNEIYAKELEKDYGSDKYGTLDLGKDWVKGAAFYGMYEDTY